MILTGKRKRRRELATGRCRIFPKAFGRISCDGPRSAPPFLLPQVPGFPWPTGIKHEQVMGVGSTILCPSAGSASYLHFATSKTGEHCNKCCAHGLGWVGHHGLATPSPCLGSIQRLLKLTEEAPQGVMCSHWLWTPGLRAMSFSPGVQQTPYQHGWHMAGSNGVPIWLIHPQSGQQNQAIIPYIKGFQNSSVRKKSEH